MTPWVTALILANVAVHLLVPPTTALFQEFVLVPGLIPDRPWTAFTYMFLHAPGLAHVGFNMLSLYFFGPAVERRLGGNRFLGLYFVSGLFGALLSLAVPASRWSAIVGASGAVYGVLFGFARFWPRERIYIWGIVGIEARVLVVIMTALSLYGGLGSAGGIAHFAHLGGFLGGWAFLRLAEHFSPAAAWKRKVAPPPTPKDVTPERWMRIDPGTLHPVNREEYERVIAKIGTTGVSSLTTAEREFLERFSGR